MLLGKGGQNVNLRTGVLHIIENKFYTVIIKKKKRISKLEDRPVEMT